MRQPSTHIAEKIGVRFFYCPKDAVDEIFEHNRYTGC
jgi:hypothetical protein